jgi:hypothetical protein
MDAATGKAIDWTPFVDGKIFSIAAGESGVYVGGLFREIGDESCRGIAALDLTTGIAFAWNPGASLGNVTYALIISGSTLFAGGNCSSGPGMPCYEFLAIDITTGNALPWKKEMNGAVSSFAKGPTTIYAGGEFGGIARIDSKTGRSLGWDAYANGIIYAVAVSGSTVYAGGIFTSIGNKSRNHIAALDTTTGEALDWNPNVNGIVHSLAVSGSTLYVGGEFDSIGGQHRKHIAALDAATGNVLDWSPNANGDVTSIVTSGGAVYVGGKFDSIGTGVSYPYFAQFGDYNPNLVIRPDYPFANLKNDGMQIMTTSGPLGGPGNAAKIVYTLPRAEQVRLRLYSISGRMMSELVNKRQNAGRYALTLPAGKLAAGIYLAEFIAGGFHRNSGTIKTSMIVIR